MSHQKDEQLHLAPSLRNARSFISQVSIFPESNLHVAGATTALTLESADHAELSMAEQEHRPIELQPSTLNMPSVSDSFSPYLASVESSDDEDGLEESHSGLQLPEILNDLMAASRSKVNHRPFHGCNPLTLEDTVFDEEFLRLKVLMDKLDHLFKEKLKHFFILSTAGKPIYSLNGNDDVLLGYMGLITTIVGSFQEGMKKEIHSISLDLLQIVIKIKDPLILVAMSKIPHEFASIGQTTTSILENQLECLYSYILAVLSKAVITKNFESRMNYDLRRILTVRDFHALDTLAMKLTYGFNPEENNRLIIDSSYYLGAVLENATRCVRISNTTRTKLNEILLSAKKLRTQTGTTDFVSTISNKLTATEDGVLLAADLLFGYITMEDRVIAHLRPRNHKLQSRDVSTLLSTIRMSSTSLPENKNTDLWIPLCMPEFNSTGFLYCYVKNFVIKPNERPVTIILVSGNKNSFFSMKEAANHIVARIFNNALFAKRLGSELSQFNGKNSVLSEVKVSSIKHFIYKRKEFNQVFMEDFPQAYRFNDSIKIQSSVQMSSIYANLFASKGSEESTRNFKSKKLTYSRLQLEDTFITGFLLTDENYEFYCLCEGSVSSRTIIDESLRIIKWCDRYKKRLFVRDGVSF